MTSLLANLSALISTPPPHCCSGAGLSFLQPHGPIASIQRLHFLEMLGLLTVFVALPIFVLIPFFAWRYRYGAKARYTPEWNYFRPLEIAAWSGPFVIVGLLGVLVWRSTHALDPYKPLVSSSPALRVQVIGYDWKWLFIYPDQGVASIGELALPMGRPISISLTSATVMQSLQIPALGSQIYAMGGMVTQLNLRADGPGRFMGENTMYNGDGFHQQKFTAVSMPADRFAQWVRNARSSPLVLDSRTLEIISRQSTHAQLNAALGQKPSDNDALFFHGADTGLFPAVVMATMNGTPVDRMEKTASQAPVTPLESTTSVRLAAKKP